MSDFHINVQDSEVVVVRSASIVRFGTTVDMGEALCYILVVRTIRLWSEVPHG